MDKVQPIQRFKTKLPVLSTKHGNRSKRGLLFNPLPAAFLGPITTLPTSQPRSDPFFLLATGKKSQLAPVVSRRIRKPNRNSRQAASPRLRGSRSQHSLPSADFQPPQVSTPTFCEPGNSLNELSTDRSLSKRKKFRIPVLRLKR